MTAAGHASPNALPASPRPARTGRPATNGRRPILPSAQFDEIPGNSAGREAVVTPDVVNTEDQHLIDACLSGRTSAFDELVRRYGDRLYNSLLRMLGSAEDARDAAQEAWVHAYQGLKSFKGNSAFYSWLFRIAYNAAVSDKRKARVGGPSLDALRDKSGIDPADGRDDADPSHRLETAERQSLVRSALAEMTEEFRSVLVLKEMDDLSYEEISEIVGCPIGTVRSRIHRARVELKEKLRILLHRRPD